MSNTAPVEKEHSSETSHATMAATSSGSHQRPMGMAGEDSTRRGGTFDQSMKPVERTPAGVMQLTSTPVDASSRPMFLVSAITAALEAPYGGIRMGNPSLPETEATLTMRP